ncbi:hypothetical protein QBC33DRAFT_597212 [Phialemonium atrogriseum]|uniref:CBM1 domain-containing protein n=1 Tax=Phialemonium atrogriseum TaxID=1093897 RepID=A0AAJ0C5Y2_9PEZI|nr:uncharacterized protein QBC33DRAFT_597212 [Phialemonium atrogriseum]KAK1770765.1 hypothetical protein QBC33DRAFT_597212 [Phialemonium atrogriseum]
MLKSLLVSTLLLGAGLCQRGGGRRPTTISRGQTQTQTVTQIQTQTRAPNGAQTIWGQCGGITYSGASACPTSAYCYNDGNIYYSQCVPNDYQPSSKGGDNGNVVTVTVGTIISVSGPTPTVVTTFITVLGPEPTPTPTSIVTVTLIPDDPVTSQW